MVLLACSSVSVCHVSVCQCASVHGSVLIFEGVPLLLCCYVPVVPMCLFVRGCMCLCGVCGSEYVNGNAVRVHIGSPCMSSYVVFEDQVVQLTNARCRTSNRTDSF